MRAGPAATVMGTPVYVVPDQPRYVLPEEVIPGVPWPPGFREETNAWSRRVCGEWNLLADGEVMAVDRGLMQCGRPSGTDWMLKMNPRTYQMTLQALKDGGHAA